MTPYLLAERFLGEVLELPGQQQHPFVQWCHMRAGLGPNEPDETAWCGSFVCAMAWIYRLPRPPLPARARSWLLAGQRIELADALAGFDVVVLTRGTPPQPGPTVVNAPGHVGFYAGRRGDDVVLLGGNQSNGVTREAFPVSRVLGVRRLA